MDSIKEIGKILLLLVTWVLYGVIWCDVLHMNCSDSFYILSLHVDGSVEIGLPHRNYLSHKFIFNGTLKINHPCRS